MRKGGTDGREERQGREQKGKRGIAPTVISKSWRLVYASSKPFHK